MKPFRPLVALVAFAWLPLAPALAQSPSDVARDAKIFIDRQPLPGGGDIEIAVGEPDSRLALAPCARREPFVPPGAKLWGRATLGVRCVEGADWTVYVPIEVRVFAPVQVAARPIGRGQEVGADDVRIERLDLTRMRGQPIGADERLDSVVTVRAVAAGEPLRRDLLRAPPVVAAGDPVRIVVDGTGFAVSTDGKALSGAGDGQAVRVATASGRILTGIARPGHVVLVK
jgi:flagella basal body P-ring formation protein FlgA